VIWSLVIRFKIVVEGQEHAGEEEGAMYHYVAIIRRNDMYYFCPGEKGGVLLKCSPDTLVRVLTEDDAKNILMEFLKKPYVGDNEWIFERILYSNCGGTKYADWLHTFDTLEELQERSIVAVQGFNGKWVGGEHVHYNLYVARERDFKDFDEVMSDKSGK
jgi:hypothetical protein